ncbi:hypothetical protein F4808DRAFT_382009 [Astrocystis sublimbata]|nr:hypothetical protein F4808DRAFT_382009 [Astrocystis sublimbata]
MDMDDFSDDDLDTLNANALQELENNAIQLTQAQLTTRRPNPPRPPKILPPAPLPNRKPPAPAYRYDDYDDDDFDDAVVLLDDVHQSKASLPSARPLAPTAANTAQLPSRAQPRPQQQQNAFPKPDIAFRPPAKPANYAAAGPRAPQQYHQQQQQPQQQHPYRTQAPLLPRPAPTASANYQASQAPRPTGGSSHDLAALQAQILDLQSKLTTREGEISIVRKRLEKTREDHERELRIVRVQTAEQLAKQERAVEAARAAQQSATTELEFTRRDLREEVVRAKRQEGPGTPKKNKTASTKTWGVSDGFEDVEMVGSPSRGKRGKNAGPVAGSVVEPPAKLQRTPTKNKRKRPALDSPATALETHSEDVVMLDEVGAPQTNVHFSGYGAPIVQHNSLPFDYMKVILNHSSAHGRPLTLEYLSRFQLKSRPNESLASILLRKLSTAGDAADPTQLPIQFCLEVLRLWDACKTEKLLAPINELLSLVTLTLQLQTVALAPYIAPTLLPVAMDSCYDVAIPRFSNPLPGEPTAADYIECRDNIDTTKILSLMYLTALGCATAQPTVGSLLSPDVDFWSSVHMQFILVYLNRKQPVDDFIAVLRLLCTSVFVESIGPINPDRSPEVIAQLLIDRISVYMTDTSRWDLDLNMGGDAGGDEGEGGGGGGGGGTGARAGLEAEAKIRELKLASLQTLSAFARSPFGLAQLAAHDWVIPRLVTLLGACIDELYDGDMQYSSYSSFSYSPFEYSPSHSSPEHGVQKVVAHTMFLLHMIVMGGSGRLLSGGGYVEGDGDVDVAPMDVSAKLEKTTGAAQKYLLSLSRLNFADDLVSEETAELAHELLELAVTSEAGVELGEFFGG